MSWFEKERKTKTTTTTKNTTTASHTQPQPDTRLASQEHNDMSCPVRVSPRWRRELQRSSDATDWTRCLVFERLCVELPNVRRLVARKKQANKQAREEVNSLASRDHGVTWEREPRQITQFATHRDIMHFTHMASYVRRSGAQATALCRTHQTLL